MKRPAITATRLRLILSVALFVIAIGASVALYTTDNRLRSFATEASHASADANASQTAIQTLQRIETELEQDQDVIERANSIVADSQSYQYQDQIITDLNKYASQAGISIATMDFSSDDNTNDSTSPAPQPSGVNMTSVSIAIRNPVVYENLLRFIRSIEQNLTKMQISNVSMAKGTGNDVTSEDLIIEVYIK